MRADGTPVIVAGEESRTLKRELIGGSNGHHDEQWLQQLLHRHPTSIPMDQIEPGLPGLVPICMELPLQSGYLDNLFMSPEGDIVIVEVKLFRNPQARREVVAQALDYASSLFGMNYSSLEGAIRQANFDGKPTPSKLYDLFGDADTLDEPAFVDAVNMNLKNGRIVVLVIGDGIRSDVEDLITGLQSHAGFHFTFALVELAVFQLKAPDEHLVIPRVLAQTCMIDRGIVRIDDQRSEIITVKQLSDNRSTTSRQSITSEQFYESMRERHPDLPDALKVFLENLSSLGVYAEFKRSLNLRWDQPSGKTINLGYVKRDGQLWTDMTGVSVTDSDLSRLYIEDLATRFGGETAILAKNPYVTVDGNAPRIESLMNKFDDWHEAIEAFQKRVIEHNSLED